MKKHLKISKQIVAVLLLTIILFTSNVSLAAWWATPAYEWGLSRGLTSVKTKSQLDRAVTHTDFYSMILRYLSMKGVRPEEGKLAHHSDDMSGLHDVVAGLFNLINTKYISKNYLTPDEYRQVESYIEHAKDTFNKYGAYLTRQNMKNVYLYMDLSQYRAATLINDREFRELTLSRLGNVKNSGIFYYGMIPYVGEITRREFLLLMFDLLTSQSVSDEAIINSFNEAGVLVGYDTGLKLDQPISYSEMLTFMYRFEIYDFNPEPEETEDSEVEDEDEIGMVKKN